MKCREQVWELRERENSWIWAVTGILVAYQHHVEGIVAAIYLPI